MAGVRTAEGTTLTVNGVLLELLSITPIGGSVTAVDKTWLSDVAKRKRPGRMPDPGQISFRVLTGAGLSSLLSLVYAPEIVPLIIGYVDEDGDAAGTDTSEGFVKSVGPGEAEGESNHEYDITVELTGVPVFTPAGA